MLKRRCDGFYGCLFVGCPSILDTVRLVIQIDIEHQHIRYGFKEIQFPCSPLNLEISLQSTKVFKSEVGNFNHLTISSNNLCSLSHQTHLPLSSQPSVQVYAMSNGIHRRLSYTVSSIVLLREYSWFESNYFQDTTGKYSVLYSQNTQENSGQIHISQLPENNCGGPLITPPPHRNLIKERVESIYWECFEVGSIAGILMTSLGITR